MGTYGGRPSTIMHIDMDAFFASVEQQCNPHYRGRPIAVVGSNKRTVVTTASYEARRFGVKTGMTKPEAKRLCPEIIFVTGNNDKYTDTCVRIVSILKQYSPKVEVYSIDESFLEIKTIETARLIKRRIKEELGLTCSVGIGPNKLIAKLASDRNKPNGLTVVKSEDVPALLENLPVEELCGIGDKTKAKLQALAIKTCGELARAPVNLLRAHFGIIGEALHLMGQGIDNSPVVPLEESPEAKSIGHSMTLERDETDIDKLKMHLLQLSEMVGRRLRSAGFCGKTVCLTIRYSDFQTFSKQRTIKESIKTTNSIYNEALKIFNSIKINGMNLGASPEPYHAASRGELNPRLPVRRSQRRKLFGEGGLNKAVRLLGVSISNLTKDEETCLFEEDRRQEELTKIMDKINNEYGDFTLTWASLVERFHHKWVISPSWRPRHD